jgi:non-heme chloroperoxidase
MRVPRRRQGVTRPRSLGARSPKAVNTGYNPSARRDLGVPHGMPTTHADVINADLLTFIQS